MWGTKARQPKRYLLEGSPPPEGPEQGSQKYESAFVCGDELLAGVSSAKALADTALAEAMPVIRSTRQTNTFLLLRGDLLGQQIAPENENVFTFRFDLEAQEVAATPADPIQKSQTY